MNPLVLLLLCVGLWLSTGVLAVIMTASTTMRAQANGVVYALCALAAGVAIGGALIELAAPRAPTLTLPLGLPWLGASLRLDTLSALFLVVINLGALAASIYAIGYGRHEPEPQRVLPFYPLFLGGMTLVLLADDAFTFLLCWEVMSLASWALVVAHHRSREAVEAGYVYLIMASFGTLCLLFAFGLLAGPQGDYGFATIRGHAPTALISSFVLLLTLLGAGSKAGLVPMHVWLPLAHPAAPSHVSALMSGVMTKVAVYAIVRVLFDLAGPPSWWWSVPLLALGGASALLGVLYALVQTDIKRVLAYSTIENIGLIVVSLGLALAFRAQGLLASAALAFSAALFHVFNHALFKTLLFCGAGAVVTATGERHLTALGALIQRMPATAVVFLTGCMAISALPPLNGFVSEWMTLQAVLLSPQLPQWTLKIMVPAVGALLALSAALAGACFVRLYGMAFLGRARASAAACATETDRWSLAAMIGLALLCLLAGMLPGIVIDVLAPTVQGVIGARISAQTVLPWLTIAPIAESRSSYNGLLVLAFITFSAWIAGVVIHRFASRALRRGDAWDCGFPQASPFTQYGPDSFAQPIRRVFGTYAFRAREHLDMPAPGDIRPARFAVTLRDVVWDALYAPIDGAVLWTAERLNALQFLTIRGYLSLVFIALVILLLVLAIWS